MYNIVPLLDKDIKFFIRYFFYLHIIDASKEIIIHMTIHKLSIIRHQRSIINCVKRSASVGYAAECLTDAERLSDDSPII